MLPQSTLSDCAWSELYQMPGEDCTAAYLEGVTIRTQPLHTRGESALSAH